jgi:hypothetical protein
MPKRMHASLAAQAMRIGVLLAVLLGASAGHLHSHAPSFDSPKVSAASSDSAPGELPVRLDSPCTLCASLVQLRAAPLVAVPLPLSAPDRSDSLSASDRIALPGDPVDRALLARAPPSAHA